MDCSLPSSSVHGISQTRILEWLARSSSKGSSQPRDQTHISWASCIGRWILYHWATWEAHIIQLFCHPVVSSSLFDPMDCSTPGLSVPHLPKCAQVHVHCISDAIQPILSSDTLFWFCPQSFPASGTFPMSQLFASDDQNTGVSASASVLPTSIQGWFPLRLTVLISLLSKGLSGFFSSTTVWMHQFFGTLPSLGSSSGNCMWPLGRP